jgi:hypothetical protein
VLSPLAANASFSNLDDRRSSWLAKAEGFPCQMQGAISIRLAPRGNNAADHMMAQLRFGQDCLANGGWHYDLSRARNGRSNTLVENI